MRQYILPLLLLFITGGTIMGQEIPALFSLSIEPFSTNVQGKLAAKAEQSDVIFVQKINIDTDVLLQEKDVILHLDGESVIVTLNNYPSESSDEYIYRYYTSANVDVSVSKLGSDIQGLIYAPSGVYNIETWGENEYALIKIEIDDSIEEPNPVITSSSSLETLSPQVSQQSNNIENGIAYIRVLVMYTPDVASAATFDIVNRVYMDINNGNTSLANSNINARLQLAYIGETKDAEGSLSFDDLLSKYMQVGDGYMDEVHALRLLYSADVCVLLVENYKYCGLGYLNASQEYAFVAVHPGTSCFSKFTFAHEIGHVIGCDHDVNVTTGSPYKYGHGYVNYVKNDNSSSWRTMMAYANACDNSENKCRRIPYWSNPNVEFQGVPTGNATSCNNARVWNENSYKVSNYYQTPVKMTIGGTCYEMTKYENFTAYDSICLNRTTTGNGQITEVMASKLIRLSSGTHIKEGTRFHAFIGTESSSIDYPRFAPRSIVKHNSHEPIFQAKVHFSVTPNPASDILNVTLERIPDNANLSIRIFDIYGHTQKIMVKSQKVTTSEYIQAYTIDETFAAGLYFVEAQVNEQKYIQKVLIQR